jgi:signal peptidase I
MKSHASVVLGVIALVVFAGCKRSVQLSGGMTPTIKPGEQVTINYSAYIIARPHRWDVVAFEPPTPTNIVVLKRIIALPSETITLTTNGIIINGTFLTMPAALSNAAFFPRERLLLPATVGLVKFPYTVPPKHYFVIGDNWTNSLDSRHYGAVAVTHILGRVMNK